MSKCLYYYKSDSTDPCFNLALEEFVLLNRPQGDYILLWQNANTIVVGHNQNAEAEINRKFVEDHGVTVVRRSTGGGAVYHDLGNLCFSFITDFDVNGDSSLSEFVKPVVRTLRELGLCAEASGKNDILVDGRKVSGNAQRLYNTRILHHGTLLFDSNLSVLSEALNAAPDKYQSKGVKSVFSRVCNIRSCLPVDMDMPAFINALKKTLTSGADIHGLTFSVGELEAIKKLADEKYRTWEWTYGRSPQLEISVKNRYPGGTLEAGLSVRDGYIENVRFMGDFMARKDMRELEATLLGCKFDRASVSSLLRNLALEDYFGAIRESEVLDTLFYGVAGEEGD